MLWQDQLPDMAEKQFQAPVLTNKLSESDMISSASEI
jgi:hypothetical protein